MSLENTNLRNLNAFHPLINSDVLFDKPCDFIGLFGLNTCDSLLHQVSAFHVKIQGAIVRLNFSSRDHFSKRIVQQGFVSNQIQETNAVLIQGKNVFRSLSGITFPSYLYEKRTFKISACLKLSLKTYSKETRTKQGPDRQNF